MSAAFRAQLPSAWQREYDRLLVNGSTPSQAESVIRGQTNERVLAIARVIKATAPNRTDQAAWNAASALLAASLETGIPVPWLMATGYFESRFSKSAVGAPVTMRTGVWAGQVVRACGPGQLLPPYSGPYTDRCWRGPANMNRSPDCVVSCEYLVNNEREAWRMAGRYFQRLMYTDPGNGYRKAVGWYSAGSAWAGFDGQDYVQKHHAKMQEMRELLLRAGYR